MGQLCGLPVGAVTTVEENAHGHVLELKRLEALASGSPATSDPAAVGSWAGASRSQSDPECSNVADGASPGAKRPRLRRMTRTSSVSQNDLEQPTAHVVASTDHLRARWHAVAESSVLARQGRAVT